MPDVVLSEADEVQAADQGDKRGRSSRAGTSVGGRAHDCIAMWGISSLFTRVIVG